MELAGITTDLNVTDIDRSVAFYRQIFDRDPDLRPNAELAEWILHRRPEIAFRVVAGRPVVATKSRIGFGVGDVKQEHARLTAHPLTDVSAVTKRPGIIAQFDLIDPDGHRIVLWQDLMMT